MCRSSLLRCCMALALALGPARALLAAPVAVASPPAVDFGLQPGSPFGNEAATEPLITGLQTEVGGTGVSVDVEVRNAGPGPLTITGVRADGVSLFEQCPDVIGGTGVSTCFVTIRSHQCGGTVYDDGQLASALPFVVAEGEACRFTLYYVKEGLGALHATFTVVSDASNSPSVVPVTALRTTAVLWAMTATDGQRAAFVAHDPASCGVIDAAWLPSPGRAGGPPLAGLPANAQFPHGVLRFVAAPCAVGATQTFRVEFAQPLPPGTRYLKYGPTRESTTPHWYEVPSRVDGNAIEFNVTDGGPGDDDLTADGTIVDQGGPAMIVAASVPAASPWLLVVASLCLLVLGCASIPRPRR